MATSPAASSTWNVCASGNSTIHSSVTRTDPSSLTGTTEPFTIETQATMLWNVVVSSGAPTSQTSPSWNDTAISRPSGGEGDAPLRPSAPTPDTQPPRC